MPGRLPMEPFFRTHAGRKVSPKARDNGFHKTGKKLLKRFFPQYSRDQQLSGPNLRVLRETSISYQNKN
jgi:hypothetical protein